jgi:hypothetical protein
MESPTPMLTDTQVGIIYTQIGTAGTQWRATAPSALGPLSAHGRSPDEARSALDQILAIARAIEVARTRGR